MVVVLLAGGMEVLQLVQVLPSKLIISCHNRLTIITVEFFVTYSPTETVFFMLRNQIYLNNSVVAINDIGQGNNTLLCVTDKLDCCKPRNGTLQGEFYYPNNTLVRNQAQNDSLYRNRGPQVIRLNRKNDVVVPTGIYRCEIPDSTGKNRSIYINVTGLRMSCGYPGNVQLTSYSL